MTASDSVSYIIGIDLGTTNSAVSCVDLNAKDPREIQIFKVPQLTGPGEIGREKVLPSFLYIPGDYDIPADAVVHPYKTTDRAFAGVYARDHGAKVPSRLVSSAKSWLCHHQADRKAKILPWGASDEVAKVSPVAASAHYLAHIRKSWNAAKKDDESLWMEHQMVVITVPASFDEVARELTVEAAKMAGFRSVTLIEEPLAAFYSWLSRHETRWEDHVTPGDLILVCDIGGGTTDFTLITLRATEGTPRFERLAVGDHLILGGDNIDLALARQVEQSFPKGSGPLSGDRWKNLCHQCRRAKETILDGRSESEKIILMGQGSRLIGGTVSGDLTRATIETLLLDGFFPLVSPGDSIKSKGRKGISEFGLPYEQEPAMTRHLCWFLEQHREEIRQKLGKSPSPRHVLFNGGSLKPHLITERIREAVRHWFGEDDTHLPAVLENKDPDLAVAVGAAYYGLVKLGKGVRVGSGSPRSYYLALSTTSQDSPDRAVCLVERGLDEGSHVELKNLDLTVLTNRPVSFDLFSSSYRSGDRAGDLISLDDTLAALPPLKTVISYGKKQVETALPVHLEADYTEMGTLDIRCRSLESDHRWKLSFTLRGDTTAIDMTDSKILDDSILSRAAAVIDHAFSPGKSKTESHALLAGVGKAVTAVAGNPKNAWSLQLLRHLSDALLNIMDGKNQSPDHEKTWLNLAGFTLRPGLGHGFDPERVKQLWKIYKKGPVFSNNAQVNAEWWILWRRVAAGLTPGQQRQFFQDQVVKLDAKNKKTAVKLSAQERREIWMALANMERLNTQDKVRLGNLLTGELTAKAMPQELWTVSRFGSREPLYGSVDRVVAPRDVTAWIEKILGLTWPDPSHAAATLVRMARKTGDRMRDLDESLITKILDFMEKHQIPPKTWEPLLKVVALTRQEETAEFGESLPGGIVLNGKWA